MAHNTAHNTAHNAPLRPLPLHERNSAQRSVLTESQLRQHGVSAALITERCRPGGPWRQLLPQVYLLRPGPPTSEQRLQAALLYAGHGRRRDKGPVPAQYAAVITGLAALALHGFAAAPVLTELPAIDVLVPHQRRLRNAGDVRIRRSRALPRPVEVTGLPCAPVARALADAVARLTDERSVRALLVEAVRAGHCDPGDVVHELEEARLLPRRDVALAVDTVVAEGRALAEGLVYQLVRAHRLPDPVWNVSLQLPEGRFLAAVDAYWPDHGVTLEVDVRGPGFCESDWAEEARRRELLESLGLCVLYVTPQKLRDTPDLQAAVIRAALRSAAGRTPPLRVVALPT